jgi:hypothetical protein
MSPREVNTFWLDTSAFMTLLSRFVARFAAPFAAQVVARPWLVRFAVASVRRRSAFLAP